jgi:S-adenosyl-L-methionine hydrolase (adenosine-forming)
MNTNGLVTLLTDFGLQDTYVGVLKGVMLQINPHLQLIDLTHQIPPQNIAIGAFHLLTAYPHFPQGTVHLAVVDPGVGSQRRGIALETQSGLWVGPDNGLLSRVITSEPVMRAVELNRPAVWRVPNPSSTFHGRDIFAAVAARLASGIDLTELGSVIDCETLQKLPPLICKPSATGWQGTVQAIDQFGNLITSIPQDCVSQSNWTAQVAEARFPSGITYSDVAIGHPISLLGSHGWVELSVNGGNAAQQYGVHRDDPVDLQLK